MSEYAAWRPLASIPAKVEVAVPVTERVPVAVMLAAVRLPETRASPWTPNCSAGVVEPIPTEPAK